jgi:hypothetical protein
MRSSDAKSNEIPPARTVQRAKIHKNLRLSARLRAFGSLIRQQCTVAELSSRAAPILRKSRRAAVLHVGFWCEDW